MRRQKVIQTITCTAELKIIDAIVLNIRTKLGKPRLSITIKNAGHYWRPAIINYS
jgi:hypothetical protein